MCQSTLLKNLLEESISTICTRVFATMDPLKEDTTQATPRILARVNGTFSMMTQSRPNSPQMMSTRPGTYFSMQRRVSRVDKKGLDIEVKIFVKRKKEECV